MLQTTVTIMSSLKRYIACKQI
uniref:Uncharacterized protein n=1 Tax=Rhizophora mucronata TaxID=61149 RepID=A0A2P2NV03_RHIMU